MKSLNVVLVALSVGIFFFASCQEQGVPVKKDDIELGGFSWKLPTWQQGDFDYTFGFNGPLKAVAEVRLPGDGKFHPWHIRGVMFEDLEYPLPLDPNLDELNGSVYYFDRLGNKLFSASPYNFGYERGGDTSFLSINVDSIVHLFETGVLKRSKPVFDMTLYDSLMLAKVQVQKKPRFLIGLDIDAPYCLSASEGNLPWTGVDFSDYFSGMPHIMMYHHIFNDGKLVEKYFRYGELTLQNFSDTIFQRIRIETMLTDSGINERYIFRPARYTTIDSLFEINSGEKIKYIYNEDGFITEKHYFWEAGMYEKDRYLFGTEGNTAIGYFKNPIHFAREVFVYDDYYRLDSHYVTINHPAQGALIRVEMEKFYYSDLNTIPDSVFISTQYESNSSDAPTLFYTKVYDEEGKTIEHRYYNLENKQYLYHSFKVEYLEYDQYHNWTHRKIYYMEFYANKPQWDKYRFLYQQYRRHQYYED